MANFEQLLNTPNVRKFLDLITYTEGTGGNGYYTAFGGGRLPSLADHPRYSKPFRQTDGKINYTSAAGKYQFLKGTWDGLARRYGLRDFSPKNQDIGAIGLMIENGALPYVLKGDWGQAVARAGGTWASLPSSPHPQPTKSWRKVAQFLGGQIQLPNNGGSRGYEQPQRDPLLDLDSPSLIKALRKKNPKMSDTEVFANLINGNGLAGQEMRQLLESDGRDPMEVASMLGLKRVELSMPTPQEPQAIEQPQVDEPQQITSDTPQYKPVSIDSVKQLIPSLKAQGMNDYQALYHLAQGDDDIGRNIRETYKRGVGLQDMAGMFGLNFGDEQPQINLGGV